MKKLQTAHECAATAPADGLHLDGVEAYALVLRLISSRDLAIGRAILAAIESDDPFVAVRALAADLGATEPRAGARPMAEKGPATGPGFVRHGAQDARARADGGCAAVAFFNDGDGCGPYRQTCVLPPHDTGDHDNGLRSLAGEHKTWARERYPVVVPEASALTCDMALRFLYDPGGVFVLPGRPLHVPAPGEYDVRGLRVRITYERRPEDAAAAGDVAASWVGRMLMSGAESVDTEGEEVGT